MQDVELKNGKDARSQEFEKVLDSVPAAVWIAHDPKGLHITGNKYSYEWLNLPVGANVSKSAPEEERPKTFIIIKDGRELKPEEMPVQVSASGQELRDYEFTLVYQDGSQRHVLGNAVPIIDDQGNPTGSVSSFIDITSRKEAEEALHVSEQRWAAILTSMGDAVIATGAGDTITFMNSEAELLTGWTLQEVLNTPLKEVFHIINENTRQEAEISINRGGNITLKDPAAQILLVTKEGREIPIYHNASEIKTEDGRLTGVVIVFRDDTDRRRSEEILKNYSSTLEETVRLRTSELEAAKERAESADRLKSSFLASISHELRTPLNSIIGFSGILRSEKAGPLNDEQMKQLGMIQASGRNLLSLINEILDLSKIEAGQLSIHPETFNILEVIDEVVKIEAPHANDKGISLTVVNPESIDIISDRQRVHQVLLNLVNNSIKFTDQGTVSIRYFRDPGTLRIEVTDTGIGIGKEDLNKIFTPFYQIESYLTKTNQGSGLGLSICKKLMEILEGTITVRSEYGYGSTFIITLPMKREDQYSNTF